MTKFFRMQHGVTYCIHSTGSDVVLTQSA